MKKKAKKMKMTVKRSFVFVLSFFVGLILSSFPAKTLFASTPMDISQANIQNTKFTVSWTTETAETSQINYGPTSSLGQTAYDDRGKVALAKTHHVTITGLASNMQYYYEIVSGGQVYRNSGQPYAITTGIYLAPASGSHVAYGQVLLSSGDPTVGAIVFLRVQDNDGVGTLGTSQVLSVLTDNAGWWNLELSGLRTQDLTSYFSFSESDDSEIISARIDKYTPTALTIYTGQDHPAPSITLGWVLNMTLMPWYQNEKAYYTGSAACQMILNYIREGAGVSGLTQDQIYNYAHPFSDGQDLSADEMDRAIGHFDPYDTLVSGFYDIYDSLADGNPCQGYNFSVDVYNASEPDALNKYMRDICHWMAFTVTREEWWKEGALVERSNTPAAVPIFADTQGYSHWVVVKGVAASNSPNPDPLKNPWNTPDFTIHGFWIKDPLISGIGENKYATADECRNTYFKPLNSTDSYNGMYIQIAEPPAEESNAFAAIASPLPDSINVGLVKTALGELNAMPQDLPIKAIALASAKTSVTYTKPKKKDLGWKNIIDPSLLRDEEAVRAFENTRPDTPIFVHQLDKNGGGYYLIPYLKNVTTNSARKQSYRYLTSGVIIIDAESGYFKEASWSERPVDYVIMSKASAVKLVRKRLKARSNNKHITASLVWQPGDISSTPYKPFWKIAVDANIYYVSQEGEVLKIKLPVRK